MSRIANVEQGIAEAARKARQEAKGTLESTVAYYQRISKNRPLTDVEEKRLDAAIAAGDRGVDRDVWDDGKDAIMCDLLADGIGFTIIGRTVGKSKSACISRFHKIKRQMGWQAR